MLGWVGWFGGSFVWGFCYGLVWFKKKVVFALLKINWGRKGKKMKTWLYFSMETIILHDGNSKESSSQGFLVMG